jgi:uncharacterized membrane protein YkvA (DUF1232 family)
MRTNEIRKMIIESIDHETRTNYLASLVNNYLLINGRNSTSEAVTEYVAFVKDYLGLGPDLLDKIEIAASTTPIKNNVLNALAIIENYYFLPNDLMPDNLGMYRLMDDSYLALTTIQRISTDYQSKNGKPLIDIDLSDPNKIIRVLLGEPFATILEMMINAMLNMPAISNLFNPSFTWPNMNTINISEDYRIKEQVQRQMGMLGIVKI